MAEIIVDTDDLATMTTLAGELDVTRPSLINWSKTYADFPAPLIVLPRVRLFSRTAVTAWVERFTA